MTAMKGLRGRINERVWDSDNIWVGDGNLVPDFAKEMTGMAESKRGNLFAVSKKGDRPTFRFRIGHEDGKSVIYQQTSIEDSALGEHTVAKYNEEGQKITDAKELWDFKGQRMPDERFR